MGRRGQPWSYCFLLCTFRAAQRLRTTRARYIRVVGFVPVAACESSYCSCGLPPHTLALSACVLRRRACAQVRHTPYLAMATAATRTVIGHRYIYTTRPLPLLRDARACAATWGRHVSASTTWWHLRDSMLGPAPSTSPNSPTKARGNALVAGCWTAGAGMQGPARRTP